MKFSSLKQVTAAGVALCVAGCATAPGQQGIGEGLTNTFNNPDPCSNNARNTGMVAGALVGTLIGAKLGDKDRGAMLAGALLGTTVGGLIGADMDKRRCDMAKVAHDYQLRMTFAAVTSDGGVMSDAALSRSGNAADVKKNAIGNVVSVQDEGGPGGHFESNSDVLTRRAEQYFSAIADVYNQAKLAQSIADPVKRQQSLQAGADRKLLLVGHTDDTGSSSLNAELSERRAKAVAQYLERRGIPREQIYYQGGGEVYPVADNHSEAGRAENRRVEIVELSSGANLSKYLEARRSNYQFYRAVPTRPEASSTATTASTAVATGAAPRRPGSPSGTATPVAGAKGEAARIAKAAPAAAEAGRPADKVVSNKAAEKAGAPAAPAARAAAAVTPAKASPLKTSGKQIDFGGAPLAQTTLAAASVGKLAHQRPLFSLISSAYADDAPVLSDCSQDRPRVSGAVRALKDGATYKVAEHVPGLYGKSWTERVNGHQIVINRVAVLASEATLAQMPELKVYADYDPVANRNPKPDVSMRPEVNTYLGEGGILYRLFTAGAGGMQCVDIVYNRNGGTVAKGGNIVYAHDNRLYVSAFKPAIAN
ncbi:OmpA family protein [Massilia sp. DWR3-1-1]|uniref:OmpA family protein n=1 Tax=Massilia sp. DWR3-1-1 TaxID=2804559 RepID=UPI003CE7A9EA